MTNYQLRILLERKEKQGQGIQSRINSSTRKIQREVRKDVKAYNTRAIEAAIEDNSNMME